LQSWESQELFLLIALNVMMVSLKMFVEYSPDVKHVHKIKTKASSLTRNNAIQSNIITVIVEKVDNKNKKMIENQINNAQFIDFIFILN
jgi:hypothetical protein